MITPKEPSRNKRFDPHNKKRVVFATILAVLSISLMIEFSVDRLVDLVLAIVAMVFTSEGGS